MCIRDSLKYFWRHNLIQDKLDPRRFLITIDQELAYLFEYKPCYHNTSFVCHRTIFLHNILLNHLLLWVQFFLHSTSGGMGCKGVARNILVAHRDLYNKMYIKEYLQLSFFKDQ